MGELWEKAQREMRPGTRFISNSFAIPDVTPIAVVLVDDRRETELHVYQIAEPDATVTTSNNEA
jgi:hypothetical protein